MKKALSLLLALLTVASLVACAADSGDASGTTTAGNADTTVAEDTTPAETELSDDLPEIDCDGQKFRIGVENETNAAHVLAPDLNGDVVNDAVYAANRAVEERFNVELEAVYFEQTNLTPVKTTILAQEDAYDVVTGHDISIANLALQDIFVDINTIPHLDYSKPWWPSYSVDSLTVGDHMLLFSNFISYCGLRLTGLMYFNKDIIDSYGIDSPYDMVFDGTWTLDEMISMTKDVYEDVNGDSTRDENDLYGISLTTGLYRVQESLGVSAYKEDSDGNLYFDINNERFVNILEKFYNLAYNTNGGNIFDDAISKESFANGHSMLYFQSFRYAIENLRDSEVDYGMLPMPKYNESQDTYISGANDRPYAVPKTATDLDFVGLMIEAMSAQGYKQVRPAFFEVAMKQKYAYDDESARVLDIITDNMLMDIAYIYSGYTGFGSALLYLLHPDRATTDFASYYESMLPEQEAILNKMQEAFDNIG